MEIFKLFGSILVDSSEAEKSISKTEKGAEGLGSKLGSLIGSAAKVGAGIAAGVGAGATVLYGIANNAAQATDRVDKLSQKIGMSRTGFQEWDYILSQSGASVEGLQMGFKTLVGQIDQAAKGTGAGAEAFKQLGISVNDANGKVKDQETVFNEAVVALQKMPEGVEKARLATQLFGRSGAELMPLLNGASGSVDELRKRAHDLGLVLGDDAVDAGVVFGDTMDDLKKSFQAVVTQVGVSVMPIIQQLADWILSHMPQIQSIISTVFGVIGTLVEGFINGIKWLIETVTTWRENNAETLSAIQDRFNQFFGVVMEFIQAFVGWATEFWQKYGDDILQSISIIWDTIQGVFSGAFDAIEGIFKIFSGIFSGDWGEVWDGVKQTFIGVWDTMKALLPGLLDALVAVLGTAVNIFLDAGKGLFNAVWDGIKSVWGSISSWVSEKASWLADKLFFWRKGQEEMSNSQSSPAQPSPSPSPTGSLSRIPPMLAEGGDIRRGGMAIVGEAGPELLNLPTGARVTPLDKAGGITINMNGATIMDDYGVDRMMDRVVERLNALGVRA